MMKIFSESLARVTALAIGLSLAMTACGTYIQSEYTVKVINPSDSVCINGLLLGNRSSEVAMPGETKTFTITFARHNAVPTQLLGLSAECRTKDGKGESQRELRVAGDATERTIIVKPSTTAPDYQVTAPGPTIELVK
jgi:hypothetical protein